MSTKEYRPTLAQLRTFVTIAEHRHFGTAAGVLNISQPSLSQALVALEQGLGLQLVERSTRRVIVTPTGMRLLPLAKATLEAADIFSAVARGARGALTGPLNIGIIPTVAPYILPDFLRSVQLSYPELEPRIIEDQTQELLLKLRDGQLDIAVIALGSPETSLVEIPLYDEDFYVIVPVDHPFAGRADLTLSDLGELNLMLLDDGHCLRDQVLDLCRQAGLPAASEYSSLTRASSVTTISQLVRGGLGASLVPESALATEAARPGLAIAAFSPSVSANRRIGMVFRSSAARAEEFRSIADVLSASFDSAKQRSAAVIHPPEAAEL